MSPVGQVFPIGFSECIFGLVSSVVAGDQVVGAPIGVVLVSSKRKNPFIAFLE